MSWRWLWFSYLPRGRRFCPAVRGEILWRVIARPAAVAMPLAALIVLMATRLVSATWWLPLAWLMTTWLVAAVTALWFAAPAARRAVRDMESKRCLSCGYDLRAIEGEGRSCSECGEPPRCLGCGHSMEGLAGTRQCPECGREQDWVPPPPNLRWLICQYWDPALPLTPRQRAEARRQGIRRTAARRHAIVVGGIVGFTFGLMVVALWLLSREGTTLAVIDGGMADVVYSVPMAAIALAAVWWLVLTCVARFAYAPAVRRAVAELGYEVCLGCGHWIREAETTFARCTECGRPRGG